MNDKPVRVYISPEQYRQLKAVLALKEISVSKWFRDKAQEEINARQSA